MGKKKSCFGLEDFACHTRDCPYMVECCKAIIAREYAPRVANAEENIRLTRRVQQFPDPAALVAVATERRT